MRVKIILFITTLFVIGIITSCCNSEAELTKDEFSNELSILINRKTINLKIFMNEGYLTSYIHDEIGHGLKTSVNKIDGLKDTIKFNFHVINYNYGEVIAGSRIADMLEIKDVNDTISLLLNNNYYFEDSTTNNDFEVLTKSTCACSVAEPYIIIDSVYIEYDEDKIVNITEGIVNK